MGLVLTAGLKGSPRSGAGSSGRDGSGHALKAKRGEAPQGPTAVGEPLGEQLVPLSAPSPSCRSLGRVSSLFSLQLGEPERV